MSQDELKELINCIFEEVATDAKIGRSKTKYKLPKKALVENVIDALYSAFSHYQSCKVINDEIVLEHPQQ
ncbi:hypothetical protein ACEV7T_24935 [Vibrio parahaemolyticus]